MPELELFLTSSDVLLTASFLTLSGLFTLLFTELAFKAVLNSSQLWYLSFLSFSVAFSIIATNLSETDGYISFGFGKGSFLYKVG